MSVPFQPPRVLAWEVTRRCPLACKHCRAGAANIHYEHELTTDECRRVIDSLARTTNHEPRTMIIWTGGEPMLRPDILELVSYATSRQLHSVMAPCGMLVTEERLAALKAAGVMACSFSLDGPDAASHDAFRGVAGAYDNVTRAMRVARAIGMPFQVNVTVSTLNADRLDALYDRAVELGASKLDLFFLVPVGRGKGIADYALSDAQTRQVLDWAFAKAKAGPLASIGPRAAARPRADHVRADAWGDAASRSSRTWATSKRAASSTCLAATSAISTAISAPSRLPPTTPSAHTAPAAPSELHGASGARAHLPHGERAEDGEQRHADPEHGEVVERVAVREGVAEEKRLARRRVAAHEVARHGALDSRAEVVPHPGDAERGARRHARHEVNRHQPAEEREKHAHRKAEADHRDHVDPDARHRNQHHQRETRHVQDARNQRELVAAALEHAVRDDARKPA